MQRYSRIYKDNGDGTCTPVAQLFDKQTGQTIDRPLSKYATGTIPVSRAQNAGAVVVKKSQKMNENSPINVAESQAGSLGLARREFMSGAGNVRTYRVGFVNGSGAAFDAYIGDGNTVAYQANSGTPIPGGVTITGTWGAQSFAMWRMITSHTPVRVSKIRINFDATTYPTTGALVGYKTRPDALADTDDYNLSTWISPDQFQSLIVDNPGELRIVWDASYALRATIPASRTVTFTFFYVSVNDVHDMRKVN